MAGGATLLGMAAESNELERHFLDPQRVGSLPAPAGVGQGSNEACGDDLRVYLALEGSRIRALRFQARSCSAVIGLASLACGELEGRSAEALAELDLASLAERGGGLPPGKGHAVGVVGRALQGALDSARDR